MFMVTFLVDDKHLATVLTGLANKVRELQVTPVVNAAPTKNGKVRQHMAGAYELFMDDLYKSGMKEIRPQDVKKLLSDAGRPSSSYSHLLTRAMADNKLKRRADKSGQSKYIYLLQPEK